MRKKSITSKLFIFLSMLGINVFAATYDPAVWTNLGTTPNWQYLSTSEVQYNSTDGCYYQKIITVSRFSYDPINDRYNSGEYTVDIYDMASVENLKHGVEQKYKVNLGATPQWQYLPNGAVEYDQQKNTYYQWRTEYVEVGNISGTHGVINEIQMAKIRELNNMLVQVINVSKSGKLIASAYLVLGKGDVQKYNNLVVFADGFDPGNMRKLQNIINENQFNNLVSLRTSADNYSPLMYGYDLVFVDFAGGAEDIRDNAKAYLKVLEVLSQKAYPNKVVAGGFSMGGIVSRLALLYGQKTYNGTPCAQISNVSKYLAADSPQQGASGVPLSVQSFLSIYAPERFTMLNNPAAIQMLYEHVKSGITQGNSTTGFDMDHNNFYQFLSDMGGYPKNIRKYSVANSDWTIPFDGNSYTYVVRAKSFFNKITWEKFSFTFDGRSLVPGSGINLLSDLFTIPAEINKMGEDPIFGYPVVYGGDNSASLYYNGVPRMPTFMPLYSVFDLKSGTPGALQNAQNLTRLCKEKWSPFDKIYLCPEGRLEHITFTNGYLKQLIAALKDVPDITPILQLLLD